MTKWTIEHALAYQYWIELVQPPQVAYESIKEKMKRLKLTPEEIRTDAEAKQLKQEN